jgi:hypothetical protein
MKKLTMALALALSAYSDESIPTKTDYHRFYIEPELSWNLEHQYKEEAITLKQWGLYYGLNIGYEFARPNFIYGSIEAYLAAGSQFSEMKVNKVKVDEFELGASKNRVEGRLGYCLKGGDLKLIPFSGAGGYFLSASGDHLNIAYIPVGMQAEYQWNQLAIGLKAEQMHFLHSWARNLNGKASDNVWGTGNYGYEISLPISFQTEVSGGKWYAAIEPYFLKLFNDITFVGGRLSAIHHF